MEALEEVPCSTGFPILPHRFVYIMFLYSTIVFGNFQIWPCDPAILKFLLELRRIEWDTASVLRETVTQS